MGAKTWMLVYSNSDVAETLEARPELDRKRSEQLVKELFPNHSCAPLEDTSLLWTSPRKRRVCVGCFADVAVVAAEEFGLNRPSKLPEHFLDPKFGSRVHLHAMHSAVDWFAFAVWRDGHLQRALSVCPDDGVIEDLGERLAFELDFWSGARPAIDEADDDPEAPYPLPFHPLELGEAALSTLFGYVLEGDPSEGRFDPEETPLLAFDRAKPRWWNPLRKP